jgi:hypothetical protein
MLLAYGLLAAPVAAALLFWGSWPLAAASAIVAVVEYATLQRSQRFSSRIWRSLGVGRRRQRERAAEGVYVIAAACGVVLLVAALLTR